MAALQENGRATVRAQFLASSAPDPHRILTCMLITYRNCEPNTPSMYFLQMFLCRSDSARELNLCGLELVCNLPLICSARKAGRGPKHPCNASWNELAKKFLWFLPNVETKKHLNSI